MDKQKIWGVVAPKQKTIYAHNLTEKQAHTLIDRLNKQNIDAKLVCNQYNILASEKYDKYTIATLNNKSNRGHTHTDK